MNKVIDVSYANGQIDWNKAKNQIDGAIIRCGFGMDQTDQDDAQYKRNVEECIRLNIPFGIYLYSYANTLEKAQSEAEHILRLVESYKSNLKLHIWYDIEDKIQANLDRNLLSNIITTFCDKMVQNGFSVGIYANNDWLRNRIDKSLQDRYMLWSASYGKNNGQAFEDTRYNHANVIMWQYTSEGRVDGIGRCDMNYYYGEIDKQVVAENTTTQATSNNYEKFDERIREYQHLLNKIYNAKLKEDGWWGEKTATATKKYVALKWGNTGNLVRWYQSRLKEQGYDLGTTGNAGVDGDFKTKTQKATENFQKKYNLSVDKIAGIQVITKLVELM